MQGFTTTVDLPDELINAIKAAVNATFDAAKQEREAEATYPLYLNKTQLCQYLNVSYNTLNGWLRDNPDFPQTTINGTVRFNREDVTDYLRNK